MSSQIIQMKDDLKTYFCLIYRQHLAHTQYCWISLLPLQSMHITVSFIFLQPSCLYSWMSAVFYSTSLSGRYQIMSWSRVRFGCQSRGFPARNLAILTISVQLISETDGLTSSLISLAWLIGTRLLRDLQLHKPRHMQYSISWLAKQYLDWLWDQQ